MPGKSGDWLITDGRMKQNKFYHICWMKQPKNTYFCKLKLKATLFVACSLKSGCGAVG